MSATCNLVSKQYETAPQAPLPTTVLTISVISKIFITERLKTAVLNMFFKTDGSTLLKQSLMNMLSESSDLFEKWFLLLPQQWRYNFLAFTHIKPIFTKAHQSFEVSLKLVKQFKHLGTPDTTKLLSEYIQR